MTSSVVHQPDTWDEVVTLKAAHGDSAAVVAGGQSLSLLLYQGLATFEALIALQRVGADQATASSGVWTIGAMLTTAAALRHPTLRAHLPLLASACAEVATPQIRNLGTVVGSVCHNEPGADAPVALLALDATVVASSPHGDRRLRLQDFLTGYLDNALGPEEVVKGIDVPVPDGSWRWWYAKHRVRSFDLALANVAVGLQMSGGRCAGARIVVGSVSATPCRVPQVESQLLGRSAGELEQDRVELGREVVRAVDVTISDDAASAGHRAHLVAATITDVLSSVGSAGHGELAGTLGR